MNTEGPKQAPAPTCIGTRLFRWGQRTYVMGILNVSPDSFSGDGLGGDIEAIVARARLMVADGADLIDVGGESTRPGSGPVPVDEELRRVVPVLERLAAELSVPLSVDTYKSGVAREAVRAGAVMINDVWGLKRDPGVARVAADAGVSIVLVSNQRDSAGFEDVVADVLASLRDSIRLAEDAGVPAGSIMVDPGIGFGKTLEQNMELIRRLSELKVLGRPVLLGTSRKFGRGSVPGEKLEATLATVVFGVANGADMVRVHDVKEVAAFVRTSDRILGKGTE